MNNSLDFLIRDMESTYKLSIELGTNSSSPQLAEVSATYAKLISTWILELEEIKRMNKLNNSIYELTSNFQSEILSDIVFGRADIPKAD